MDALGQLEDLADQAQTDGSYQAAVRAKTQARQIRAELDRLDETARASEAPATTAEHELELMGEVRRMRLQAREAGSYVASANLLKLERDLVAERRAREEEERDRNLAHQDEEEILDAVLDAADELPDQLVRMLAKRLEDLIIARGG